jgi:hypothetical protein
MSRSDDHEAGVARRDSLTLWELKVKQAAETQQNRQKWGKNQQNPTNKLRFD